MNKKEWNEGLNNLEPQLVEKYIDEKDRLSAKRKKKTLYTRIVAVAACACIILGAIAAVSLLKPTPPIGVESTPTAEPTGNTLLQTIPINKNQLPIPGPQYYGSDESTEFPSSPAEPAIYGMTVLAEYVDVMPDTYTFYDDWNQHEFRLIKLKTIELFKDKEAPDEFYYIIPVDCMTDYSVYHQFAIYNMAQYGYDNTVIYNKTKDCPQMLDRTLFGYYAWGWFYRMGEDFVAYDSDGNFDARLWNSTDRWMYYTKHSSPYVCKTVDEVRKEASDDGYRDLYYRYFDGKLEGEAAELFDYISSLENGVYVSNSPLGFILYQSDRTSVLGATRYINNFATNEKISIWIGDNVSSQKENYSVSKARFTDDDLDSLPDLSSALAAVRNAYTDGKITPPHIKNYEENSLSHKGIFAWYAKTENGVIGIVRVSWRYGNGDLDDIYYVIEHGQDECRFIDRDDLVKKIGDYETTYIFTGDYDENGKVYNRSSTMR